MLATSIRWIVAMRRRSPLSASLVWPFVALFVRVDMASPGVNLVKFVDRAWLKLLIFTVLRKWRRGRDLLHARLSAEGIRIDVLLRP